MLKVLLIAVASLFLNLTNAGFSEDWALKLPVSEEDPRWHNAKATLRIGQGRLSQFEGNDTFPQREFIHVLTNEEKLLIVKSLSNPPPLRFAVHPNKEGGFASGLFDVGEVAFETEAQKITIHLTPDCFCIEPRGVLHFGMFSPYFARAVSEIVKKRTGRPLPEKYLKRISGQSQFEIMNREFEKNQHSSN